eukprot:351644-Chlamydomonas_euryale.AAC.3
MGSHAAFLGWHACFLTWAAMLPFWGGHARLPCMGMHVFLPRAAMIKEKLHGAAFLWHAGSSAAPDHLVRLHFRIPVPGAAHLGSGLWLSHSNSSSRRRATRRLPRPG